MNFPARLHVLLASQAPLGLVIRRGPSKQVATFLWNRRRDDFQLGQWLKGRLYERRSDLSCDGKHLIYFASNGKWHSEAKGAWTAISRAPYLKALALFPKGDCWHGGGLWTNKNDYWINDGYGHFTLYDTTEVRRDRRYKPQENYGGECLGVYYPRLLRDGWRLTQPIQVAKWKDKDIFEKNPHMGGGCARSHTLNSIHPRAKAAIGTNINWCMPSPRRWSIVSIGSGPNRTTNGSFGRPAAYCLPDR